MSNKNLTILGIAAVLMVVVAVATSKLASVQTVTVAAESPLIQGFNPEKIAKISVASGEDKVTLVRHGQGFAIAERDNYSADMKKVNNLIKNVLDIKVAGEVLTEDEKLYSELLVTDDSAERAVTFYDSEDKVITGVIVGKSLDSGSTAVRLVGGNKVSTTSDSTWFNASARDYMDTKLLDVAKEDVRKVAVKYDGGSYEMASEPGSNEVKFLTAIPEGKKLKEDEYVKVFNALAGLNFSDVNGIGKVEDVKFDTTYVAELDDSTVYTVEVGQKESGQDYYLKVSSKFTDMSQIEISQDESEEELKKKEKKLLARDNSAKFNALHKGWVYKVASYKGGNFDKTLEDLIEDAPEPEPEIETADVNDVNSVN